MRDLINTPAKYRFTEWPVIIERSFHWFTKGAMRFFGSRILWSTLEEMAGDNYTFITSEQYPSGERVYSVREAYPDGTVNTLGEFGAYKTRAEAIKAQIQFHKEKEEDYMASFDK